MEPEASPVTDGTRGKPCYRWNQRQALLQMEPEASPVTDGTRGKPCYRWNPRQALLQMEPEASRVTDGTRGKPCYRWNQRQALLQLEPEASPWSNGDLFHVEQCKDPGLLETTSFLKGGVLPTEKWRAPKISLLLDS